MTDWLVIVGFLAVTALLIAVDWRTRRQREADRAHAERAFIRSLRHYDDSDTGD
jgi:FtsZ-interacting cell division protein ZipA